MVSAHRRSTSHHYPPSAHPHRRTRGSKSSHQHDYSLEKLEVFGDANLDNECEWPTEEQLESLPLDKRVKLRRISFKQDATGSSKNGDPLGGIQLGFTGGVTSPLFQAKFMDSQKLQHVPVDLSKHKIARVSMYVYTYSGELLRMKFTDSFGQVLFEQRFRDGDYSLCHWYSREIPPDRDIIGVYCNTSTDACYIKSLGFILWRPNPALEEGSTRNLLRHQ